MGETIAEKDSVVLPKTLPTQDLCEEPVDSTSDDTNAETTTPVNTKLLKKKRKNVKKKEKKVTFACQEADEMALIDAAIQLAEEEAKVVCAELFPSTTVASATIVTFQQQPIHQNAVAKQIAPDEVVSTTLEAVETIRLLFNENEQVTSVEGQVNAFSVENQLLAHVEQLHTARLREACHEDSAHARITYEAAMEKALRDDSCRLYPAISSSQQICRIDTKLLEYCMFSEFEESQTIASIRDLTSLTVTMSVNGSCVTDTLLDTGAGVSCISAKYWRQCLGSKTLQKPRIQLVGVDGTPLKVYGCIALSVGVSTTGNTVQQLVYVCEGLKHDLILGLNFLDRTRAVLDFNRRLVSFRRLGHVEILSQLKSTEVANCAVKMPDSITIPAHSEIIVAVPNNDPTKESTVRLVEPKANGIYSFSVANSLCDLQHDHIPIRLCNHTSRDITPAEGTIIATLQPVQSIQVLNESKSISSIQSDAPEVTDESVLLSDEEVEKLAQSVPMDKSLTEDQRNQYLDLIRKNIDVFSRPGRPANGTSTLPPFQIQLSDGSPVHRTPYRLAHTEKALVDKEINDLLKQGHIKPSASPYAAPVVLVQVPGKDPRFCCDYRELNARTVKDKFPLPRIEDCLDALGGSKFFALLDLKRAYHQIAVDPKDRYKTAFVTSRGQWEWISLPFGLANAPAHFQRAIAHLFHGLAWEQCLIYLDDIIVFASTFEEHLSRLQNVFDRLRKGNLQLKASKCSFGLKEVPYLGHIVSPDGIRPNPRKVKAISQMQAPVDVRGVRSFVNTAGYYRRFIAHFSAIAKPLTDLTRQDVPFKWTVDCQQAFETLRTALLSEPILRYPDFKQPFKLITDASGYGLGAVLAQVDNQGREYAIAYASRLMNKHEKNYSVTEQECLAVIYGLKQFRPYLYGQHFTIVTDHAALQWLMKLRDPNGRLARWSFKLMGHDFDIVYRPGRLNDAADGLSRFSSFSAGGENKEKDQMNKTDVKDQQEIDSIEVEIDDFIIEQILEEYSTCAVHVQPRTEVVQAVIQTNTKEFLKDIKKDQSQTPWMRTVMQHLCGETVELPRWVKNSISRFSIQDGILYRSDNKQNDQLVLPEPYREKVIHLLHADQLCGHAGTRITIDRVLRRFWWPAVHEHIRKFVKSCSTCATAKGSTRPSVNAPLQPIPVTSAMGLVSADLQGPFPKDKHGYSYVITFIDHLTRFPVAYPLKDKSSAEVTKAVLRFICEFGCPDSLLTDRGGEFLSGILRGVYDVLGIKKLNTTSYHPQGNALVERVQGTCTSLLRALTKGDKDTWSELLPYVLFAIRTSYHPVLQDNPFHLMFGRDARLPLDILLGSNLPRVKANSLNVYKRLLYERMRTAHAYAKKAITETQQKSIKENSKKPRGAPYAVGDRVWLYQHTSPRGERRKLRHKWHGPFRIIEIGTNPAVVKLQGTYSTQISPYVNIKYLRRCYDVDDRPTVDPNDLVEGTRQQVPSEVLPPQSFYEDTEDDEFEVDDILGKRFVTNSEGKLELQYLVSFKGYDGSSNMWLPKENLSCARIMNRFETSVHKLLAGR